MLSEHRSDTVLHRIALADAQFQIAFEHSVLGTTVTDRYQFEPSVSGPVAVLIEERFEGEGYGLPHAAQAGEQLVRDGQGWRLSLRRVVQPLVVRPLPAQRMRLLVNGQEWMLAQLSTQALELRAQACF